MVIVGVSFDDPATNQAWAEEEEYLFDLWTDDERTLALYYAAIDRETAAYPDRVTRLLDTDGAVLLEYNDVNVVEGPGEVLEDCQVLFGGG